MVGAAASVSVLLGGFLERRYKLLNMGLSLSCDTHGCGDGRWALQAVLRVARKLHAVIVGCTIGHVSHAQAAPGHW